MKLHETIIPGCFEIEYISREDARGSFVKTFHSTAFREMGLEADFLESFFSYSHRNVLRGMHFQLPPADGAKLVYCMQGHVLDVALDLRVGSPAYGEYASFELSAKKAAAAYIPRGVAHGFCTLEADSAVVYHVTSEYDSKLDSGVLWDSFGFPWPGKAPVISERDSRFASFRDFKGPFRFERKEIDI
jgi:dTDP-4-dehydrorhamnose 3,5-epimerase